MLCLEGTVTGGNPELRSFKRKQDTSTDDIAPSGMSNNTSSVLVASHHHQQTSLYEGNITRQQSHTAPQGTAKNVNSKKNTKKSVSINSQNRTLGSGLSMDDTSFQPASAVQTKSVSMVVTINKSEDEKSSGGDGKITGLVSLLCIMYAIFIVTCGILFPVSETLQGTWLNANYSGAFYVYLYIVGTVFMIYLQISLMNRSCDCKKPDCADDDLSTVNNDDIVDQLAYNNDNYQNDDDAKDDNNNNNNEEIRNQQSLSSTRRFNPVISATEYRDQEDSIEIVEPKRHKLSEPVKNHVTAFLRINSTTHLNTGSMASGMNRYMSQQDIRSATAAGRLAGDDVFDDAKTIERRRQEELLDEIPRVDEVRCFQEEVTEEVFIDLSQLGGIFSHHGSSFFLRIGTLLFGVGHMIYIILEIQGSISLKEGCTPTRFWWVFIVRLIFIVVQTFVIFKNPMIIVGKKRELIYRFGFMHAISTNMCIWLRTLLSEISLEANMANKKYNSTATTVPGHPYNCTDGVLQAAAPYLFPFVLEYSLLCICVIGVMYSSLSESTKDSLQRGLTNLFKIDVFERDSGKDDNMSENGENEREDNLFTKSHRGIFAGFLLTAGIIISLVFFNFSSSTVGNVIKAELLSLSTDLSLIVLLLAAAVAGIILTSPLSFIKKPNSIDDALLMIAMFGGIMYHIALIMAAIRTFYWKTYKECYVEVLRLLVSSFTLLFLVAQVLLILSGLRRYPSKQSQIVKKPGRGVITFLVLGNIASWIFHSILAKNHDLQYTPSELFGKVPWIIMLNLSLPLLLFFFFHSSVCLADIWHQAYIPLHSKVHKPSSHHQTQRADDGVTTNYVDTNSNNYNELYGSTTSNLYSNNSRIQNHPNPRGQNSLSAINFLSPLMRSVSVSQLNQVPPPQPQAQNLSPDCFHGSLSQMPNNLYTQKNFMNKTRKLSPLASPVDIPENLFDHEVHM